MHTNIWIRMVLLIAGYIQTVYKNILLLIGTKTSSSSNKYTLAQELISKGPESFARFPTGIKIGRAIFVPFLLLSQLYSHYVTHSK